MKTYCETHGLSYGICTAEDFLELRSVLMQKNRALAGFAEQDIEKRISPAATLPGVKSIVILGLPYGKTLPSKPMDVPRGEISMGAVGEDYHRTLMGHLEEVAKLLRLTVYKAFADTGPLVDRAVACRAGLGVPGKNQSIRTSCGSAVFFGYLLTTDVLPVTPKAEVASCGTCAACIRNCPTGALTEDGFHIENCISYITQKKGMLTKDEMKKMGSVIYGCDICQKVCPHNKANSAFSDIEAVYPTLQSLLEMTEGEFRRRFGHTAAGWRGRRIFQRNALIALFHQGEDISPYQNHGAQLVRDTAKRLLEEE